MRTLGVIPARLASTRLPRKVLRKIAGRPMLQWVVEAARACAHLEDVVVATDAEEVRALCVQHGWRVEMTAAELASGSDRVHAVAQRIQAEIYVNIQGDEPMLRPEHIAALLAPFEQAETQITTLKVRCAADNLANPNAVKVVTDVAGRALYFSRATIPYDRDGTSPAVWKHLGVYAYTAQALRQFHACAPSALEVAERLEQLRMLENGMRVQVVETAWDTVGVDTEEDLRRVEALLKSR